MNAAQLIPDCTHIRRCDAHDLAEMIVSAIEKIGRPLAIYLGADGAIGYEFLPDGPSPLATCMSLVGRYDEESTVVQIREDLLAMQRERIHGKAEA